MRGERGEGMADLQPSDEFRESDIWAVEKEEAVWVGQGNVDPGSGAEDWVDWSECDGG